MYGGESILKSQDEVGDRFEILLSFLKMAGLPPAPPHGWSTTSPKESLMLPDVVRLYQILGENVARTRAMMTLGSDCFLRSWFSISSPPLTVLIYFCNFADVVILVTLVEAVKCVPTPVGGPEGHICAHAIALVLAINGVEHLYKNLSCARIIIEILKFFQ